MKEIIIKGNKKAEEIKNIPYVKDFYIKGRNAILKFEKLEEKELQENIPDRVIKEVKRIMDGINEGTNS